MTLRGRQSQHRDSARSHRDERKRRKAAREARAVAVAALSAGTDSGSPDTPSSVARAKTSPAALPAADPRGGSLGVTPIGQRGRRASSDPWLWPLVGVVAVILLAAAGISAVTRPPVATRAVAGVRSTDAGTAHAITHGPPTPVFARFRSVPLHLPMAPEYVTTLAFHQASYKWAQHMDSLVRECSFADAKRAAKRRSALLVKNAKLAAASGAEATVVAGPAVEDSRGIWTGRVIRLWRSGRRGRPDTAADVGARPGTRVLAPCDGRVTLVKSYKLYGKYPDYEIHIDPLGVPGYEMIVIHVRDPVVARGDVVTAGVTPVARVRRLSGQTTLQLKAYTGDGGDHVHLQMNRLNDKSPAPLPDAEEAGLTSVPR